MINRSMDKLSLSSPWLRFFATLILFVFCVFSSIRFVLALNSRSILVDLHTVTATEIRSIGRLIASTDRTILLNNNLLSTDEAD